MSSAQPPDPSLEVDAAPARMVQIRRKSLVIAFFVAVGTAALAYVVGWAGQRSDVVEIREDRARESAELTARVQRLESRVTALEARRQLSLALSAIDERNFGIATGYLRKASELLKKLQGDGEPRRIADEVAGFRLVATENLADQRATILTFSKALDDIIDTSK